MCYSSCYNSLKTIHVQKIKLSLQWDQKWIQSKRPEYIVTWMNVTLRRL